MPLTLKLTIFTHKIFSYFYFCPVKSNTHQSLFKQIFFKSIFFLSKKFDLKANGKSTYKASILVKEISTEVWEKKL